MENGKFFNYASTPRANDKNRTLSGSLLTSNSSLLEELESSSESFWNVCRDTANFLSMLIKISNSKSVLELGTSNGYSAIWIADALKSTGGKLTTIEFWDNRLDLAKANFEKCGLSSIITTKLGSATDVLKTINDEFDFVFIDANKSEYIKYFELIHPMLKKGGIIAADNILSHSEKVKPFVERISVHPEYQTQILNLPDGLLIAYKQ